MSTSDRRRRRRGRMMMVERDKLQVYPYQMQSNKKISGKF
jgi:hypothetical protein